MIDVAHRPDLVFRVAPRGTGLPFHTLLFLVKRSVGEAQMARKDQIRKKVLIYSLWNGVNGQLRSIILLKAR